MFGRVLPLFTIWASCLEIRKDPEDFSPDIHLKSGLGCHSAPLLRKLTLRQAHEQASFSYSTLAKQNRLKALLHPGKSSQLLALLSKLYSLGNWRSRLILHGRNFWNFLLLLLLGELLGEVRGDCSWGGNWAWLRIAACSIDRAPRW